MPVIVDGLTGSIFWVSLRVRGFHSPQGLGSSHSPPLRHPPPPAFTKGNKRLVTPFHSGLCAIYKSQTFSSLTVTVVHQTPDLIHPLSDTPPKKEIQRSESSDLKAIVTYLKRRPAEILFKQRQTRLRHLNSNAGCASSYDYST